MSRADEAVVRDKSLYTLIDRGLGPIMLGFFVASTPANFSQSATGARINAAEIRRKIIFANPVAKA
jgi:hypothetical protein